MMHGITTNSTKIQGKCGMVGQPARPPQWVLQQRQAEESLIMSRGIRWIMSTKQSADKAPNVDASLTCSPLAAGAASADNWQAPSTPNPHLPNKGPKHTPHLLLGYPGRNGTPPK